MFESALRKIERANQHIADLKSAFEAFTQSHPHTLSISNEPDGSVAIDVRFREPVPERAPEI